MDSRLTIELAHRRTYGLGGRNTKLFIDFERLAPKPTGLAAVCSIGGDVAQPRQCPSLSAPVTEVPGKGEGLGVVLRHPQRIKSATSGSMSWRPATPSLARRSRC